MTTLCANVVATLSQERQGLWIFVLRQNQAIVHTCKVIEKYPSCKIEAAKMKDRSHQ
jgi:hypothetical protein